MTCLSVVQTVFRRIGLNQPVSAVTSTDQAVLQVLSFVEEAGQAMADEYPWQTLQKSVTFTTVAAETQTTVAAITTGFNYIVNDTIWNRTLRRPVYGPQSQTEWQESKAMQLNGPFNSFRIQGDSILFFPVPVAGQTCAFEYITKNWITLNAGGTGQTFANDADVPLMDEQILALGAIWRWKAAKGFAYQEDEKKYELRLMDAKARDAGKPTLSLAGAKYEIQPVVIVPAGSWGV